MDLPHWSARPVSRRYFTCNWLIGQPNIFITGGKFDQAFGTSKAKVQLSHNMVAGGGILYNITCGISVSLRAVGLRWGGYGMGCLSSLRREKFWTSGLKKSFLVHFKSFWRVGKLTELLLCLWYSFTKKLDQKTAFNSCITHLIAEL